MSDATCVLRASGRRFAAKRYLATSTFVARVVTDNSFDFVVSERGPDDPAGQIADAERFLTNKQLNLSRLLGFPGVERVALVFHVRAVGATSFVMPARLSAELGRHGLELEVSVSTG